MALWQSKRGLAIQKPNPLQLGEFGLDTDTMVLWLGSGVANEDLRVAGKAVTADFTIYVAASAYGGGASDANGLAKRAGTATGTTANKLIDGAASFDSTYVDKTLYNVTDDAWAKITAVDSAAQLSLSADIMVLGESYEISNAFSSIADGFNAVPGPYSANVTVRTSPGAFSDTLTFIGKIAAGSKALTMQGSTTGTTAITGNADISQKIRLRNLTFSGVTIDANYGAELDWKDCPLANVRFNTFNGSDVTWDNCDGSGATKLYTYLGSKNLIRNAIITIGNDPTNITSINSTIARGYTMYVATPSFGGNDAVADGLPMYSGTATSTTANKLIDSNANFGTDVVGKTVYNSTDDTWDKVTARDSATQLTIADGIMASGEAYAIVNAFSTVNGAINAVPGTVNCDTTLKIMNGTFTENLVWQGKAFSGTYKITAIGTKTVSAGPYAATSGAASTITKTGAGWTVDAYKWKMARIMGGTGSGQVAIIKSNTSDTLTIAGVWYAANEDPFTASRSGVNPDSTSTFVIEDWATALNSSSGYTVHVKAAQQNIYLKYLDIRAVNPGGANDRALFPDASCLVGAFGCKFSGGKPVQAENYGSAFIRSCYGTAAGSLAVFREFNGNLQVLNSAVVNGGAGMNGIRFSAGNGSVVSCLVDNNGGSGIYVERNAVVTFDSGANATTISNNGGWGLQAVYGSRAFGGALQTYSGNTSGTYTADASSSIT